MIDDGTAEENTYTGASTNADPQITINMGKTTEVTALRYHRGTDERYDMTDYRIEISQMAKHLKSLKKEPSTLRMMWQLSISKMRTTIHG